MAGSRRVRNARNAALAVAVAIPALVFQFAFVNLCRGDGDGDGDGASLRVCEWGREHPILLLNAVFFLNVDVAFWIISLAQRSTWLIDPYWTVLPVLMHYFYATHPRARRDARRAAAVASLLWVWSLRLTHSYFRREDYQWGEREDWRFADLRKQHPRHWWWMSFFATYLSQQVFLVGVCLPFYAVHSNSTPWNGWDVIAVVLSGGGIAIAYLADTQLHEFMVRNRVLRSLGAAPVPVLREGVWRYSRHPNYVGEQMWWWGLALVAWNMGQGWMAAGAAVNTGCLAYVTVLVERKMVTTAGRASAYRRYQESTCVWIPWKKPPSIKA